MDEEEVITPVDEQEVTPQEDETQTDEIDTLATEELGGEPSEDGDDTDVDDAGESEEDGEPEEAETLEIKLGGDSLEVPKGTIPDEIVSQIEDKFHNLEAGATKKFQEAAELRKSTEARATALEAIENVNAPVLLGISEAIAINKELEQLRAVDLDAVWQSDQDQARRISDRIGKLERDFATKSAEVQQGEAEIARLQGEEKARMFDEGAQAVEKRIKGFKEKHLKETINYAVTSFGLDREEAEATWALNPPMVEATFKAMQWDKMQARAKQKAKPKTSQAKPVTAVAGKGGKEIPKDPAKQTMEQYAADFKRREAERYG